jgi:hypothetical protein
MPDRVFIGLLIIWCVTTAASLLIHFLVVCPRLYRTGSRFPVGFLPWRWLRDMHRYKEQCRAVSDSLSPYYIFLLLAAFNVGLGLLLLTIHLQRLTSPYG